MRIENATVLIYENCMPKKLFQASNLTWIILRYELWTHYNNQPCPTNPPLWRSQYQSVLCDGDTLGSGSLATWSVAISFVQKEGKRLWHWVWQHYLNVELWIFVFHLNCFPFCIVSSIKHGLTGACVFLLRRATAGLRLAISIKVFATQEVQLCY